MKNMIHSLPDDWSPFTADLEDRSECEWCGATAKYRFRQGGVLACKHHFRTAGREFVAFTEVY